MPRNANIAIQNKFLKGLITEATVLTFPEDAATETFNCVFDSTGTVTRRLGFDHEGGNVTVTQSLVGAAITTYLWKNVAGEADISFVVTQTGDTLHFYRVLSGAPLSANKHATTINLPTFAAGGVTTVSTLECQFTSGNGYLFVTNENCDPFYVTYDAAANTLTAARITIKIRDFKGSGEIIGTTDRPTTLTSLHRYDLSNQGWTSRYIGESTTSNTIGTGSKTFTVSVAANLNPVSGDRIRIYSAATPGSLGASTNSGNIMIGTVTSYSGTTLIVNVTTTNGAGTLTDWRIVEEPDNLEAWNIVFANYPSNADIWWRYKNSSDVFTPATKYLDRLAGNTLAPKGHFILDAFNENRATAAGISGIPAISTGAQRPATCAFFAGRVWYAGVQFPTYNSRMYFSQTIESTLDFGLCHQENDPTSEESFAVLPTDGGVIDLNEAGTIVKMIPMRNALILFCSNGVWALTGSQGLGFTPLDFSLDKISSIVDTSAASFVDVDGTPFWWSLEGIYTVTVDPNSKQLQTQSISDKSIRTFIETIPLENRKYIKGSYDPEDKLIQWLYRSDSVSAFDERYRFDRMLNYNLLSTAFYPWVVDTSNVSIHSVVAVRAQGGQFAKINVIDGSGNNVIDGAGNQVIVFEAGDVLTASKSTVFKYFTSELVGGVTKITFSECFQTSFQDWGEVSPVSYQSYFVTGYMIHGEGIRKFQTNYVKVFSDANFDSTYKIRGQWDFSTSGSSGKWGTSQIFSDFFSAKGKRVKLRGHGSVAQIRIENNGDNPFAIIGWCVFETSNKWV